MVSRIPHDVSYKTFFRFPDMVRALLLDFVPERWVARIDFDSLTPASGPGTTDDLRERPNDLVWKVRLRAEADPDAASPETGPPQIPGTGREAGLELREDIDTVLEPGMVISMEPMLTIPEGQPGAGGYREHDILFITEDGNEDITKYPYGPETNVVG